MNVLVVHSDGDQAFAARLHDRLREAGVTVLTAVEQHPDVAVVILSFEAAFSETWNQAVADLPEGVRIAPVRRDDTPASAFHERVAAVQWVDARDDARFDAAFGSLLAGLEREPELYRRTKELGVLVDAWETGGRKKRRLLDDVRHVEAMTAVAHAARTTKGMPLPLGTAEFLDQSLARARSRRRTLRFRGALAVGFLVVGATAVAAFVPALRKLFDQNKAGLAVNPAGEAAEQMPEWSSLLSGAAILEGVESRTVAAEAVLRQNLTRPWPLGSVDLAPEWAIDGVVPLSDDTTVGVLIRNERSESFFAVYRPHTSEFLWTVPVVAEAWSVSVDEDEQFAYASGPNGLSTIDLDGRSVVETPGSEWRVALPTAGGISVLMQDGELQFRSASGEVESLGSFDTPIDFRLVQGGGVRLLAQTGPEEFRLIDGSTGEAVSIGNVEAGLIVAGAALHDGTSAVVTAHDRQLWRFDIDGAHPTGLGVPDLVTSIASLSGDRVALGGQAGQVRIFDLATSSVLGTICTEVTEVVTLTASWSGDLVACVAHFGAAIWPAPAPAADEPGGPLHAGVDDDGASPAVEMDAGRLRFQYVDGTWSEWVTAVDGTPTVLTRSPDGTELLIGASSGEVAIVSLQPVGPIRTVYWHVPNASPVTSAGWVPSPQVGTADERFWAVPECNGCGSVEGLLTTLASRLHRCWSETQLQWVDDATRKQLGVGVCTLFDMDGAE